jgi:hypothetical protein
MAIRYIPAPPGISPNEDPERIASFLRVNGHPGAHASWWTEDRSVLVVDSENDPTSTLGSYVSQPTLDEVRLTNTRLLVQDVRQVVTQIEALPNPNPEQRAILANAKLILEVVRYLWRAADAS